MRSSVQARARGLSDLPNTKQGDNPYKWGTLTKSIPCCLDEFKHFGQHWFSLHQGTTCSLGTSLRGRTLLPWGCG
jgi:hypothetical protein